MNKIILLIFICLCSTLFAFSEINTYTCILVSEINDGSSEGEIGYNWKLAQGGGQTGPTTFTISERGFIYVCDYINNRINIYDLVLKYVKTIKETRNEAGNTFVFSAYKIKVDIDDNIVAITMNNDLEKIDKNGKKIYNIYKNDIPQIVNYDYDFFLLEKNILFNDEDGYNLIDEKGKILKKQEAINFINIKKNNLENTKKANFNSIYPLFENETQQFLDEKKLVFINGRVLSSNLDKHRSIYKFIKNNNKFKTDLILDKVNEDVTENITHKELIGFDIDNNSYWDCRIGNDRFKRIILICSNKGELIDCFYNKIKWSKCAVSPSGDVYFMSSNKNGTLFHKTERQW